ncbi:Ubiquitin carboxyl-terminal hydrolase 16 [Cytospora mali]|uniref:Ubiquitin carboxyl-terminal hydrolase n=1 Tax=Cytospora mali TaxID=578113 RepID=A0A194VRC6_CYTMA|nr:Ubiquitin carboxyl-terminal hydrolase 16 [Valsa mali]
MPEKPLTVAAYAAGASLAAVTLVYVFAPTYFLDNDPAGSTSSTNFLTGGSRKKGVVGLVNPANDCFINSILQALAGLGDLRLYLIREMHRRSIDEEWIYVQAVPEDFKEYTNGNGEPTKLDPEWKVEGQQRGLVTQGLKEMLDQLNERPIYKKTISATPLVQCLEKAFRQRISRQQQDAQEFLQVVAERLCDEYHAGHKARRYARWKIESESPQGGVGDVNGEAVRERLAELASQELPENGDQRKTATIRSRAVTIAPDDDDEEGFPMEGKTESQIECLTCGFKPRPTASRFCTLTLSVPYDNTSTTLNACFDGMFKTEYIDDFKCEKCRLVHAQEVFKLELRKTTSDEDKERISAALEKLEHAIDTDPEHPPEDVVLPDSKYAPQCKIARHTRVTRFPKILAIHLNRSIYASQTSLKNSAKVAFPERLPLGGLLFRRNYKLLGVVTHKGSHYSGHYESFRRQNVYPPYSNTDTFQPAGVYSKTASPMSTPLMPPLVRPSEDGSPLTVTPDMLSPASVSTPSLDSTLPGNTHRQNTPPLNGNGGALPKAGPTSVPKEKDPETSSLRSLAHSARSTMSKMSPSRHGSGSSRTGTPITAGTMTNATVATTATKASKKRKHQGRWWRISDEKIKEASTREVLSMQREVYLLFYELERDEP